MNGDATIVAADNEQGHRRKRIKRGAAEAGEYNGALSSGRQRRSGNGATPEPPERMTRNPGRSASILRPVSPIPRVPRAYEQGPHTAAVGVLTGTAKAYGFPMVTPSRPTAGTRSKERFASRPGERKQTAKLPETSLPPHDLAQWIAHQVIHSSSHSSTPGELQGRKGRDKDIRPSLQSFRMEPYPVNGDPIPGLAGEDAVPPRTRPEKKQLLRNDKTNKGLPNLAKTNFRIGPGAEPQTKRRISLEFRDSTQPVHMPASSPFAFAKELRDEVFSGQNSHNSPTTFIDAISDVSTRKDDLNGAKVSQLLNAALADASNPTSKAYGAEPGTIANNTYILRKVRANIKTHRNHEEAERTSGNGTAPPSPTSKSHSSPVPHLPLIGHDESRSSTQAMYAIVDLLNDMTAIKTYASPYDNPNPGPGHANEPAAYSSPYGNPMSAAPAANGSAATVPLTNGHASVAKAAKRTEYDRIDSLLALANGGSLIDSDDEEGDGDDVTIADPDELANSMLDFSDLARYDPDIIFIAQRVVNNAIADARNRITPGDRDAVQRLQDQIVRLHSLFSQASIAVNAAMPSDRSWATMHLYNYLLNRLRASALPNVHLRPPPVVNYGYPMRLPNGVLWAPPLPRPRPRPPPLINEQPMSGGCSSVQKGPGIPGDEQTKAKSYGFPPLPRSKLLTTT